MNIDLLIALALAFALGGVWGALLMTIIMAGKRRTRIITARHLRYGKQWATDPWGAWSMSWPVTDLPASYSAGKKNANTRARQVGGDHYRTKTIQPWDAMQAWMTPEQFRGFLRGNAIKYLARCDDKGGMEDIKKAGHYIAKLTEGK